jgi:hypothetical protein
MEDGGMEWETKETGDEGGWKQNLRNKSAVPIFLKLEMWYTGWLFYFKLLICNCLYIAFGHSLP